MVHSGPGAQLLISHRKDDQWRTQDFSMGGGFQSQNAHRDDVKILHYNYSSLEVLKCIVL